MFDILHRQLECWSGCFGLVSSTIEGLTSAMASSTLSTFSVKSALVASRTGEGGRGVLRVHGVRRVGTECGAARATESLEQLSMISLELLAPHSLSTSRRVPDRGPGNRECLTH